MAARAVHADPRGGSPPRQGAHRRSRGSVLIRYFDASALIKRYAREAGSTAVRRLLASGTAATSRLSEVEIASALTQRTREGEVTASQRDRALAAFTLDLESFLIVELVPKVTTRARALLLAHSLRAGDAIQLASCVHLAEELRAHVPLVVCDDRLVAAARALEITVLGGARARRSP